ncbi:RHS repeat-associated core domain-containing protein [Fictibacillus sp. Mic-4]|uniref:RHS repeat domain-containing protein n=1 Tax=Fictibacillus TaxID=1329200 RepID=UPI001FE0AF17|nr:RHS repeat-associated core domain-containing protein [Fictibacillus gelatini]
MRANLIDYFRCIFCCSLINQIFIYYNPGVGRFLTLDPELGEKENPITQNGYTYADNNPVMMVAPDGE